MKKDDITRPEPGSLPARISFIEQDGGSAGYYVRFKDIPEDAATGGEPERKYIPILQHETQEEALQAAIEYRDRRAEELGLPTQADQGLLPTRKGTEVATSHLRRSVKRYARKADIEEVDRVSPHTLRHTFATRLYRETGNIRMVQKALGHSDLSTTMVYTHVIDEELEGAMKGL